MGERSGKVTVRMGKQAGRQIPLTRNVCKAIGDYVGQHLPQDSLWAGQRGVGTFPSGAAPYGLLDLSGNIWEWTRTIWGNSFKYPYISDAGRENLTSSSYRVLRGGSFKDTKDSIRCASRMGFDPAIRHFMIGFRVVVVSPFFSQQPDLCFLWHLGR